MKKLLLALLVLASLASCGKNNSVGSSTSAVGTSGLSTSGIDQSGRVPLSTYISNINNNGFNAAVADNEIYRFYTSSSSGNGCTVKWGFLTVCTGSSSSGGTYSTVNVVHSSENLAAKKTELINIIAQAYAYSNSSDKLQLYVQAANGDVYTIDFRVPMSANPVVKRTSAGLVYFDYSFSGYSQYTTY